MLLQHTHHSNALGFSLSCQNNLLGGDKLHGSLEAYSCHLCNKDNQNYSYSGTDDLNLVIPKGKWVIQRIMGISEIEI